MTNEPTNTDKRVILEQKLRVLNNTVWSHTIDAQTNKACGLDDEAKQYAEQASKFAKIRDKIEEELSKLTV